MAGLIYPITADHINEYGYRVKVPMVALAQPREYTSQDMAPIFEPYNPTDVTVTRLSINRMVQLFLANTKFHVLDPEDTVEIFHMIDKYLMTQENRIAVGEPSAISYCRSLLKFREMFYRRHFLVALNKNPIFKQAYMTKQGDLWRILELFSGIPGAGPGLRDPIDALATPPVKVPEEKPDQVVIANGMVQNHLASMGFSQNQSASDPQVKFDPIA